MKVVLLEDVRKVGKKGDVVNVSDGYGQNFLIKNKLAVKETAGAKKILEQQKEEARLQDIENKKNAEALKEKIEGKDHLDLPNIHVYEYPDTNLQVFI